MEVTISIGNTAQCIYMGRDDNTGEHIFMYTPEQSISIKDEYLQGKSVLRQYKSFTLKRNTTSDYTVIGEV